MRSRDDEIDDLRVDYQATVFARLQLDLHKLIDRSN